MNTSMRTALMMFMLITSVFGQSFEVKDRNGVPVVKIDNVKMFRYSDYFKEDTPAFQGTVTNITDEKLFGVSIVGNVHKKDGTGVKFKLDSVCERYVEGLSRPITLSPCDFPKGFTHKATQPFMRPWPFTPGDFDSVDFTLESAQRLTTEDGFHVSGFVAKDEGCFNDYLATKSLTGVILRKKLVELIEYGCGFVLENPQAADIFDKTKKLFGVGTKKVAAVQVMLLDEGIFLGHERSAHFGDTGWVLVSSLAPGPVLKREEIGVVK